MDDACVADGVERHAAAAALTQTAGVLSALSQHGSMAPQVARRQHAAQLGLFGSAADDLLRWLAAGPPGDCSLCDDPGMQGALAALRGVAGEAEHVQLAATQRMHAAA